MCTFIDGGDFLFVEVKVLDAVVFVFFHDALEEVLEVPWREHFGAVVEKGFADECAPFKFVADYFILFSFESLRGQEEELDEMDVDDLVSDIKEFRNTLALRSVDKIL